MGKKETQLYEFKKFEPWTPTEFFDIYLEYAEGVRIARWDYLELDFESARTYLCEFFFEAIANAEGDTME
jgi:hypothetical protein